MNGGNEDAMKSLITHRRFYIFCALKSFLNRDIKQIFFYFINILIKICESLCKIKIFPEVNSKKKRIFTNTPDEINL